MHLHPYRRSLAPDVLRAGVADASVPGAVLCVYVGGQRAMHVAFGTTDGFTPVTRDTVYDLASLTKPLATAAVTTSCLEDGTLLLDDRVGDLLDAVPEHLARASVRHLLTHTSGLPAWMPCYGADGASLGLDAAVRAIFALPACGRPPGEHYEYSCLGFLLLTEILRRATGRTLDVAARERIFAPVGLLTLTFQPDLVDSLVAPTGSDEGPARDRSLVGVVHDGNARAVTLGGDVPGNAGLFGTAADVAAFGEALRIGRLFGAAATDRALSSQIPATVGGHTLLFYATPNALNPTGDLLSPRAVGHSGFTGTALVIDPEYELTVAIVTNAVYLPGTKPKWLRLRRRLMNTIAGALRQ